MAQDRDSQGIVLSPKQAVAAILAILLPVLAYIWTHHVKEFEDCREELRRSVAQSDRVIDAIIDRLED